MYHGCKNNRPKAYYRMISAESIHNHNKMRNSVFPTTNNAYLMSTEKFFCPSSESPEWLRLNREGGASGTGGGSLSDKKASKLSSAPNPPSTSPPAADAPHAVTHNTRRHDLLGG